MIELELQALSLARQGLLIEVGRTVAACGYALVRQRLADDEHGILLTMVVRGPERQRRALEAALDAHERIVSFELAAHVPGVAKPHFAASSRVTANYMPPPPPPPAAAPIAKPAEANHAPPAPDTALAQVRSAEPVPEPLFAPAPAEQQPAFEFVSVRPAPSPSPAPEPEEPFVEVVRLEANVAAVETLLPTLMRDYPQVFRGLKQLDQTVEAGARETSLELAGQRIGRWVFERHYAAADRTDVDEAMQRIGAPALGALLDVQYHGQQLHIRHSPLCADGRSGCKFFSGFLEGVLAPAITARNVSIFEVCCRSYGADECVLAVMD